MVKKFFKVLGIIFCFMILVFDFMFLIELKRAEGNPAKAAAGVLKSAANSITEQEPIYFLLLGENKDLGQSLTDTLICMGYNPKEQKAFIVSIPRDTFIRKKIEKCKTK